MIAIPLNFMRNYTVPMGDIAEWDRTRAAIVPIFMPLAFFVLMGFIGKDDKGVWTADLLPVGLWLMIPGAIAGIYIRFRMK